MPNVTGYEINVVVIVPELRSLGTLRKQFALTGEIILQCGQQFLQRSAMIFKNHLFNCRHSVCSGSQSNAENT